MKLVDQHPVLDVLQVEYLRLLGYPPGRELEGRAKELADWARHWYSERGQPWMIACRVEQLKISDDHVRIGCERFTSKHLCQFWQDAAVHEIVLAGVSAGPELEAEAGRLWRDARPDEYFFLEVFGSAVVEHLIAAVGSHCCILAEQEQLAVLPHYSPGYSKWDISDQPRLLELIKREADGDLPGELSVLDTGMLRPKKSQLAVFGLTHEIDRVQSSLDLVPCTGCAYSPCRYRRKPYVRAAERHGDAPLVVKEAIASYDRPVRRQPSNSMPSDSSTVGV